MTAHEIPGTGPKRHGRLRRRRRHPALLLCGWRGHFLVGADAARLRPEDALFAREYDGARWLRCLRCDAWIPLAPPEAPAREVPPSRDEIEIPLRGKALRDQIVLRLIAIDRAVHFVILIFLAAAIFLFVRHQTELRGVFYKIVTDLQGGLRGPSQSHSGLVRDLDKIFSLQSGELDRVGGIVLAYALLEGVEAVGLWFAKRWAEYLTFIATCALLPLEVHELAVRVSVLKIITMTINVAVAVYLIYAKRLFGIRGGGAAEQAERERDMGWAALERTAPPVAEPVAGR
jgi:uncharacterized membrane protein (DUF2068 family)